VRHITGTSVYTYLKCPRAVELDCRGDASQKRAWTEAEELALARGREHEATFVATLGYACPAYPEGDFTAGAAATEALLRGGAAGVHQGVLLDADCLGIPDLLRREPGASGLGDFHYVVGDVKSSAQPRGDQILQVCFYSRLLAALQGRAPAYGFLVLKDGREERFDPGDFAPALADVVAGIDALRRGARSERPFLRAACGRCPWSPVCGPELEDRADLSLLAGMTSGMRDILERAGISRVRDAAALAVEPLARKTHLEPALLRRLQRAAQAALGGGPLRHEEHRPPEPAPAAILHGLWDRFADRLLALGALYPDDPEGGRTAVVLPAERADEAAALDRLVARLPGEAHLVHFGESLPRWHEENAWRRTGDLGVERRFLDLAVRLRSAVVWPRPAFQLADYVRLGLGLDPHREGDADAAALWTREPGGEDRLQRKVASDLRDLARLKRTWVDAAATV
jgi:predicted RecB family nuclease